jgi:cytochrome c5
MKIFLCGFIVAMAFTAAVGAQAADGKAVYTSNCAMCHDNLAPKIGDKTAWAPLIMQGDQAMVANVVKGKGAMQPRAGKPSLSDANIEAAVEYIESKSK